MSDLSFAEEFPAVDDEQWRAVVEKALRGADFERALVSTTYDGLRIEPLAVRERSVTFETRAVRTTQTDGAWEIRQLHAAHDPATTNAAILEDLEGGVGSIEIRIEAPGQTGLQCESKDDLARALDGVPLNETGIWLSPGVRFEEAAAALQAVWSERGIADDAAKGGFGADPLGSLARTGALPVSTEQALASAARLAVETRDRYPHVTALVADSRPYHDGGASEAQELAALSATAVAYLRALEAEGVAPADGLRQMAFTVAADMDLFLTVAKLRAARALLNRIADASGAGDAAASIRLHVSSSERMMARRDPHVNMLRTTVACAGAALGGADSITVLPYSWTVGQPDRLARRMARNTQIILEEESALGHVLDPAAGSWHLDKLSDELSRKAWELFQDIERAGGMMAALAAGTVQGMVRETAEARARDAARGKNEMTGVSAFPNINEAPVDAPPHGVPHDLEDPAVTVEPIPLRREAEPFEQLREASDAHLQSTGNRPRIFLANLGTLADFTARTAFSQNFFAAGGIETPAGEGASTAEEAAAAFRDSGATIACLCSSDALYDTLAEETARALKEAGATHVVLAGRPGDKREAFESAGIGTFIHLRCDMLGTLKAMHDLLGVRPTN